ncbi:nucleoside triphosphate pyrophosphohydrolase family protein [Cellulosimicrobium aquatile]|nr:nucleoside triphosphate pyrophosphohydrolase family protein [Cellulosimicrobium aquatile]
MDFTIYQAQARRTDRTLPETSLGVHVLGLAGQAGSVVSEYKKWLRDGPAHQRWHAHMAEELGDVLWYLAAIASDLGLDLGDVAVVNLDKTQSRWGESESPGLPPLDLAWPDGERLPRRGTYTFVPAQTAARAGSSRERIEIWFDGRRVGDRLTDAATVADGYRFHDILHLSFAVMLGWSPVTRALLGRKRRSDPAVDENEDGGRAIVVEEGISALVFAYAAQHRFLAEVSHVDKWLLDSILLLAETTEVRARRPADWERTILAGFAAFRTLRELGGGQVEFDADAGSLMVTPSPSSA